MIPGESLKFLKYSAPPDPGTADSVTGNWRRAGACSGEGDGSRSLVSAEKGLEMRSRGHLLVTCPAYRRRAVLGVRIGGWHASPLVSLSMRRARRLNGLQIVNRELPIGDCPLYPSARGAVIVVLAGDGTKFLRVCSDLPDREGPSTPQTPAAHGAAPPGADGPAAVPASTSAMAPMMEAGLLPSPRRPCPRPARPGYRHIAKGGKSARQRHHTGRPRPSPPLTRAKFLFPTACPTGDKA